MDRHRYLIIPNSPSRVSAVMVFVVFCLVLSALFVLLELGGLDWIYDLLLKDAAII